MEFGRVPETELGNIDFSLPQDTAENMRVLQDAKSKMPTQIYTGCAKWGRPDWVGKLYPKGTKEKDYLSHYVTFFNSIEMNATHYRIFDVNTIKKWKDTAPDGFVFCPKFYQGISHLKRLKNCEELTSVFLDSIYTLEEKLGPCFLQLHDNFGPKSADDILNYLIKLPRDFSVYLELRNKGWWTENNGLDDFFTELTKLKTGLVITDAAGRRDCAHMKLTTPDTFIRFVGNSLHNTDYTRIDEWVQRMKTWADHGMKSIYFFMHQHDELYSPELIKYLIEQLNKECGWEIPVPQLYNQPQGLF